MHWNRDAGLHTLAAQSLGNAPCTRHSHPPKQNNTAGCCCTMTEPLPQRPNAARYTPPARRERGGAGEEMTSNSCSLYQSLCVLVHLSYLSLSEKIPPALPFPSHCDSTAPPMGGTRILQAQSRRL